MSLRKNQHKKKFITSFDGHAIILEVDEDQHRRYKADCEVARIQELADVHGISSLHVLRYNPHAFLHMEDNERREHLLGILREALSKNICVEQDSKTGIVIEYHGYTEDRILKLENLLVSMQAEALEQQN